MKYTFILKIYLIIWISLIFLPTELYSKNYSIFQVYAGECNFEVQKTRAGYVWSEIINFDSTKTYTINQVLNKINEDEEIIYVSIGINLQSKKISLIEIKCEGDEKYLHYFIICLTDQIEAYPSDKIENEYRFTDKSIIKKNFEKIQNETDFTIYQYKKSRLMGPVPVPENEWEE